MKTINLRDYYPFYHNDLFIEVSDEVAAALQEAERQERNYLVDGGEPDALRPGDLRLRHPEDVMTMEQLYAALDALPDKQGRRLYAHYILGVPQTEIARAEGVGLTAVNNSIERGLRNMEKMLKNIL